MSESESVPTQQEQFDISGVLLSVLPQVLVYHFTPLHCSLVLGTAGAAHVCSSAAPFFLSWVCQFLSRSWVWMELVLGSSRPGDSRRRSRDPLTDREALAASEKVKSSWARVNHSASHTLHTLIPPQVIKQGKASPREKKSVNLSLNQFIQLIQSLDLNNSLQKYVKTKQKQRTKRCRDSRVNDRNQQVFSRRMKIIVLLRIHPSDPTVSRESCAEKRKAMLSRGIMGNEVPYELPQIKCKV